MEKKLLNLEEENNRKRQSIRERLEPKLNGIACPECGEELYDREPLKMLTSFPPKKSVICKNCNYTGFRIV